MNRVHGILYMKLLQTTTLLLNETDSCTNTHVWWNILCNNVFFYSYGSVWKIYFVFNHAMMTSSDGNFPRYWPFERGIHHWPVNSPHKGQWCGALVFSLVCDCTNVWVNNRDAGGLRRHYAYCEVIVKVRCKQCTRALMATGAHLTETITYQNQP